MPIYYWYEACPACHQQGELCIFKDVTNNRLYLHCGECESGWWHPDEVNDPKKRFLTLTEEFEAENPTYEEICRMGWKKYALHKLVMS